MANGFLIRISTFIAYYYYKNIDGVKNTIEEYYKTSKNNDNVLIDEMMDLLEDFFVNHPNILKLLIQIMRIQSQALMTLAGIIIKDTSFIYLLFKTISSSKKYLIHSVIF